MLNDAKIIRSIMETYGSPVYVFREDDFIANYRRFERCMQNVYDGYRLAYSFKTNYVPYICSLVKKLGGMAEVVSDMEYALALKLGFADGQIIYNGPVKGEKSVEAFLRGSIVNADSLEETEYLAWAAGQHPERSLSIGLRLNIDVGQRFVSRFGIDATEDNIKKAQALVSRAGNLSICGIHFHVSQARGLEAWRQRAKQMLDIADAFFNDSLDFIDLGSGMYGFMEPALHSQFDDVPSYEDYAEAVAGLFAARYGGRAQKPLLITEPGTTVISSYMDMLSTVKAVKQIKGRTFLYCDASSLNVGEIASLKKLPLSVIPGGGPQAEYREAAITGYTCLEHDVLLHGFTGRAAMGDTLVFGNVGGYSVVSKPPFIRPNCPVVAVNHAGDANVVKRAERFEDVFETYIF